MRLTLSTRKTLEENASQYFEAAKKYRKKHEGAQAALKRTTATKQRPIVLKRKKQWFERFRWTFSPQGVLIIGGKDASSNEVIVKKHMEPSDTVLHTEMPGSPFVIIKGERNEQSLNAAATLCVCYSKAWKQGLSVADVFWVLPEQVSKTANTGEFVGKGSFIIRGERNFLHPQVELFLGIHDGVPAAGKASLFEESVCLKPGKEKPSDLAKKLVKLYGFTPDDWLPLIPAGGGVITNKNSQGYKER